MKERRLSHIRKTSIFLSLKHAHAYLLLCNEFFPTRSILSMTSSYRPPRCLEGHDQGAAELGGSAPGPVGPRPLEACQGFTIPLPTHGSGREAPARHHLGLSVGLELPSPGH